MKTRLLIALSFSLVACGLPSEQDDVAVDSNEASLGSQAHEEARRERDVKLGDTARVSSLTITTQQRVLLVTVSEAMSPDALLSRLDVSRFSWRCEVSSWKSDVVAELSCTEFEASRGAEARALPWLIGRTDGVARIEVLNLGR